ncbi:type II toxin-antitoxin system Phd/YefM family antitoxin [Candidatus Binatia bacterium]|nr:type II toxin-antitoxin system Phd/YefM family antitoxin [Candidatus Binatia bacterium]
MALCERVGEVPRFDECLHRSDAHTGAADIVEGHDEEIVITRNGRAAAVLVNPADLESWKETATVRADANLVAEIRRGLRALTRGKAKLYTLDELFAD